MKTQKNNSSPLNRILRIFVIIVAVILLGICFQYARYEAIAINDKLQGLNDGLDSRYFNIEEEKDSAYLDLYKEKVWLETKLQVSRTDSISLMINFEDSVMQLELKGVVLKTSKIKEFKLDKFFDHLSYGAYYNLFGTQMETDSCYSSIAKEPFTIKQAPKDSTEVQVFQVDTTKIEIVHWGMLMKNGVRINIEGVDSEKQDENWLGEKYWLKQNLNALKENLVETAQFRKFEYLPEIRIVVEENDAKAVYRALPLYPVVCVKM